MSVGHCRSVLCAKDKSCPCPCDFCVAAIHEAVRIEKKELYLPWSCDEDGNIFTSANLDLLREVGSVHPSFAPIIVEQMNKLESKK